ncbi:sugar O-acetyltransferase [Streptomyces sp. NPDC001828]|uniref:sugar O-acetyltransferase n=1 Tax=Streptomyces sp. NPDC001828 TaxID=3364615 RepID=UPI0036832E0C
MTEKTMKERLLAGESYRFEGDELAADFQRSSQLLQQYNATLPAQARERARLLSELLAAVGTDVDIRPPFHMDLGFRTHIGDRVFINFGAVLEDIAEIRIEDDVLIGPGVRVLTPTHPVNPDLRRQKWESAEPITIGRNAWIGGAAVILPGVTIGENSVIGAGAVVVKDIPAHTVAVGNPARPIRDIP